MASAHDAPPGDTVKVAPTGGSTQSLDGGYTLKLGTDKIIGNGSFGVVFEAKILETGETVAIKKVLQDKRFKNRELQIMKQLKHPNVVQLRHYFYQTTSKRREADGQVEEETFLNLVLEFIPDTVYKITRQHTKVRQLPPLLCVKLYVYQMLRSLAYLHSCGICHRDIKPQNLLVDSRTHVLKLCDFGSAKSLTPGEPSVAYICSRYYRAPELIFGSTDYSVAIDIWSAGCVAAELLLGHPLFPGETGVDQLVEIIKVLGTPTREEVEAMNRAYTEFKFPQIKPYPWSKIFRTRTPPEAIDLISKLLQYVPTTRLTAIEACAHPFFDEIRLPVTRLPDGGNLPVLFNFAPSELEGCSREVIDILLPAHARKPDWVAPASYFAPPKPAGAAAAATAAAAAGSGSSSSSSSSSGGAGASAAAGSSASFSASSPVAATPAGAAAALSARSAGAGAGSSSAGAAPMSVVIPGGPSAPGAGAGAGAGAAGASAGRTGSGGEGKGGAGAASAGGSSAASAGAAAATAPKSSGGGAVPTAGGGGSGAASVSMAVSPANAAPR